MSQKQFFLLGGCVALAVFFAEFCYEPTQFVFKYFSVIFAVIFSLTGMDIAAARLFGQITSYFLGCFAAGFIMLVVVSLILSRKNT